MSTIQEEDPELFAAMEEARATIAAAVKARKALRRIRSLRRQEFDEDAAKVAGGVRMIACPDCGGKGYLPDVDEPLLAPAPWRGAPGSRSVKRPLTDGKVTASTPRAQHVVGESP
jgi:hypothetical protein